MKILEFLQRSVPDRARVFVVSGTEEYLRGQAVEKIVGELDPGAEVEVLHAASATNREGAGLAEVLDDLRTQSLFGGGERLIHVKGAEALVAESAKALERFILSGEAVHRLLLEGEAIAPKNMKVVPKSGLLGAVAKTGGVIVTCAPLYASSFGGRGPAHESPLSRWVQSRAGHHGKRITLVCAWHLHRLAGTDLRRLDGELQKLALYAGDRQEITEADVEHIVAGGRMAPLYSISEAVAGRDLPRALEESRLVFEHGTVDGSGRTVRDPDALALMLTRTTTRRVQKVLRVCEFLDEGRSFEEAAEAVRELPWARDKLRAQAYAFRRTELRARILGGLRELERGLKSGGGPPRMLFDRFLVRSLGEGIGASS